MSNTNSIGSVVKILETPKKKMISQNISVTQCIVQFPQNRKNSIVSLQFWGNLANDVATYYKINDYILIEGYLIMKEKSKISSKRRGWKTMEITVLKVYPFLLNYDRSLSPVSTY